MPEPYILLSAADIDAGTFARFMAELGGEIDPQNASYGRLSKGRCHLWVYLNTEEFEFSPDVERQLIKGLGGPPQSALVLEYSHGPHCDRLVVDFAVAFATRWRAMLNGYDTQIFELADLIRLQREASGLPIPG